MALFSYLFSPCSLSSDPRPNSGRASPGLMTSTVTSTSCAPVHPWRPTSLRTRRREPPHRHSCHRAEAPRPHGSSTRLGGRTIPTGSSLDSSLNTIRCYCFPTCQSEWDLWLMKCDVDTSPPNVEPRTASHSPELRLTGDWWVLQSVRSTAGLRRVSTHSLLTGANSLNGPKVQLSFFQVAKLSAPLDTEVDLEPEILYYLSTVNYSLPPTFLSIKNALSASIYFV